ncbi:hypothetical protein ANN_08030 [Periplaneta americana]|uniref:Uncharacterized protein n=1 Tax=Periplaneta americana TaxID=6978 RepID=A0ABQ8T0A2_PERAM|nr:hypothetical protein ANN_08030 [Periplaneta americana]
MVGFCITTVPQPKIPRATMSPWENPQYIALPSSTNDHIPWLPVAESTSEKVNQICSQIALQAPSEAAGSLDRPPWIVFK